MRKLFSIGALLLLASCGMTEDDKEADKRVTYIEFSDEAFERYCLENYDLNADGRFSKYEAERVLYIDCSGMGVESLYGIENFVQLRELRCSDNEISYLELNRNVELEYIECRNNRLSLLAVDELRVLYSLDCSENLLPQLDLRFNNALAELNCSSNYLKLLDCSNTSRSMRLLDCSNNPNLEVLYLHSNQTFEKIFVDGWVEIQYK